MIAAGPVGRPTRMLFMAAHLASSLPGWLQDPSWLRPLTRVVRLFILHHQAGGLFFVIFLEELGVPLPAPGDAAIAYGGYLTTTGAIPYPLAYLGVIAGAVLGSACNLTISRKYGRPFIRRYGGGYGLSVGRLKPGPRRASPGGRRPSTLRRPPTAIRDLRLWLARLA